MILIKRRDLFYSFNKGIFQLFKMKNDLLMTNSNPFILFIFTSFTVNFGAEYPYFYQFIFL